MSGEKPRFKYFTLIRLSTLISLAVIDMRAVGRPGNPILKHANLVQFDAAIAQLFLQLAHGGKPWIFARFHSTAWQCPDPGTIRMAQQQHHFAVILHNHHAAMQMRPA